jgi:hypothetical protein
LTTLIITVETGTTKMFLSNKKTIKRLFRKHQFMVTVGPLAAATVSDEHGVFELLTPNSTAVTFITNGTTRLEKQTCYATGRL